MSDQITITKKQLESALQLAELTKAELANALIQKGTVLRCSCNKYFLPSFQMQKREGKSYDEVAKQEDTKLVITEITNALSCVNECIATLRGLGLTLEPVNEEEKEKQQKSELRVETRDTIS